MPEETKTQDKEIKQEKPAKASEESKTKDEPKPESKETKEEKPVESKVEAPKTPPKTDYKEFTIPLREKVRVVPRYKKANKAVKTIKEYLARHMKVYDRDLDKIKIDKTLNEIIWSRGIKKPPHKVKVRALKDSEGLVRVEAVDVPDKLKFKLARELKREKIALEAGQKKKGLMQRAKEGMTSKPSDKTEEEKTEEKEKAKAGEEAGKQLEKQAAKKMKHESGGKTKKKTQPVRQALSR